MAKEQRLIDIEPVKKFIVDGLNSKEPNKAFGHDAIEILAEIEYAPTVDAVVFPCEIGDPVWFIPNNPIDQKVTETTVEKLVLKKGGVYMKLACNVMYETSCKSIGKTVFFARAEAEAALSKMKGGEGHD